MSRLVGVVIVAGVILTGCGSSGQTPDAGDKERISGAAVLIVAECIGGTGDVSAIEDQVTVLLAEKDEAGDARFTLSKKFSDVTMSDILRDRAKFMRTHRCAPEQAARLESGA